MTRLSLIISMLMFISFAALTGCDSEPVASEEPDIRPMAFVEDGPVRVTARLSADHISIAQRIECVIRSSAPLDYQITFPDLTGTLGDFTIVESTLSPPQLADGGVISQTLTLLLEPFLAGEYIVPAIPIAIRQIDSSEPTIIELALPPVAVESSLDDSPESATIGDVKAPLDPQIVEVDTARSWRVPTAIAVVVALLGIGATWLCMTRMRAASLPDPFDIAMAHLDRLATAETLPDDAVDIANHAVRACLASTVEPTAASLTVSQLIASTGVQRAYSSSNQDSLEVCLRLFERAQFAPRQEDDQDLRSSISVAARLASLLASANETQSATTDGHAIVHGSQA